MIYKQQIVNLKYKTNSKYQLQVPPLGTRLAHLIGYVN